MRLQRPTVTAAVLAAVWAVTGCGSAPASVSAVHSALPASPGAPTLYVVSYSGAKYSGTVTPINTADNRAGHTIKVGSQPAAIAVTPDGKTVYVASENGTVTPITTATNQPGHPIKIGGDPVAIAITPDGETAYVANWDDDTVTPITTATNQPGHPINVGGEPTAIAITPDGKTAYVICLPGGVNADATVTPINTITNKAGKPVNVGGEPDAIAITPDGQTVYVANQDGTVTPITTATDQPRMPIKIGGNPVLMAISITPDGKTAYVVADPRGKDCYHPVGTGDGFVVPITTATDKPAEPIRVGHTPVGLAITPDGKTVYVPNGGDSTVTPIATATNAASQPIPTGNAGPVAILIAPGGRLAYAVTTSGQASAGSVIPIATGANTPGNPIGVGDNPIALAMTPSAKTPYTQTLATNSVLGFSAMC